MATHTTPHAPARLLPDDTAKRFIVLSLRDGRELDRWGAADEEGGDVFAVHHRAPLACLAVYGPLGVTYDEHAVAVWDLVHKRLVHCIPAKQFDGPGDGAVIKGVHLTGAGLVVLQGSHGLLGANPNRVFMRVLRFPRAAARREVGEVD